MPTDRAFLFHRNCSDSGSNSRPLFPVRTDSNPNGSFVWRWGRITITLQLLLALLLAHTPGLRGQETPVPSEISFDATGRVSVRVTASPDTYSVLFRGNELQSIPDPIAVEVEGNAPGDLDQ
ncbi:MAG: hypothetical protein RIS76_1554, partial [Verrucomicrobiota bacterium]